MCVLIINTSLNRTTMRTANTKENQGTITGVFRSRDDAEKAYNSLLARGYSSDQIILLMSDKTHREHFKDSDRQTELGSKAAEKAGVGSAIGGTTGAVVGALAALGTAVAIPGLGLVVAGPIVAGLAGCRCRRYRWRIDRRPCRIGHTKRRCRHL